MLLALHVAPQDYFAADADVDADADNGLLDADVAETAAFGSRTAPRARRLQLDTGPSAAEVGTADSTTAASTTTSTTTTTLSPRSFIRVRAGGRRGPPGGGSGGRARAIVSVVNPADDETLQTLGSGDIRSLRQRQAEQRDSGRELQDLQDPGHTHITRLDVDCSSAGIGVTLEFQDDFAGVVYSKGYYDDPSCRCVSALWLRDVDAVF